MEILTLLISNAVVILASSGFWAWLMKRQERKDVRTQMLIGLGHDRIICLGGHYIQRGYVTTDEYENLYEYLYKPYQQLGGNGSAARVMEQVKRLPTRLEE